MYDVGVLPARHRLTVDEYYRMADAGIFGDNQRIELIDGDLIDMAPIGQPHEGNVASLNEAFVIACAGRGIVWTQSSIRLDVSSAPQPDLAILKRREDFYATGNRPGPADVLLVVEVSDSSLRFDQQVKLPLYARAGIPEYWIVDVQNRILLVHRQPAADGYLEMATHGAGDELALLAAPEIVVRLALMFG